MAYSAYIYNNALVALTSFVFFYSAGKKISLLVTQSTKSYASMSKKTKMEFHFRNNSTIHAVLVTALCIFVLIWDRKELSDPLWGVSWKAEAITAITLGYLLADFVYLLRSNSSTTDAYWSSMCHHLLTMSVYLNITVFGCFSYISLIRLTAEMSTPFVNMRWVLDVCGMKLSKIFVYNGWLMVLTFFCCRILVMPYGYYVVLILRHTEGFRRLGVLALCMVPAALIDLMNLYWFSRMIKGLLKYLDLQKRMQKSNGIVTNGKAD
nr:transmembrane protein 56-B-like [Ciona intestinalis]|eukprot:XP_002131729.1 transmembrane protein 56-B-like [Ciona intestinalis]